MFALLVVVKRLINEYGAYIDVKDIERTFNGVLHLSKLNVTCMIYDDYIRYFEKK